MFRIILTATAASLLASTVASQSQQIQVKPVQNRLQGVYSMTKGYEPAPAVVPRVGPITKYDNYDGSEVYYSAGVLLTTGQVQTWTIDDEMIDQAAFPQAGFSGLEQINQIVFAYCSTVPDPGSTGDVLPVNLYFYNDWEDPNTAGPSPSGWPMAECEYLLNLPGGDVAGNLQCHDITLDLTSGFECAVPQELTPGLAEPFGIGWTYGDPRPSPNGNTGPVVDSILTTLPGYGALDESSFHNRTAQTYIFNLIGNGSNFYNSHAMELYGLPTDVFAYYHRNPQTQQFDPQSADTLDFQVDASIYPGSIVTFSVLNPQPAANYTLLAATAPFDLLRPLPSALGGAGGTGTLLVNLQQTLAFLPMAGGSAGPLQIPPTLTLPALYFQAAEHTGNLGASRVTQASNGLKAVMQ